MKKVEAITDVQVLEVMVTLLLRKEYSIDEAPTPSDYTVELFPERFNQSSDVHVNVKVGRGVTFDITQHWPSDDHRDMAAVTAAATEIADNIATIHEQREEIMDMCREVRSATRRQIAKAKRQGLDYRFVAAYPVSLWDSVRDGFAVHVVYERLSEYLRMEPVAFDASYAAEVVESFDEVQEQQLNRAIMRYNLDAIGATGRIDSVLVNALREAGHNVPHVLQRLAAEDSWIVDIGKSGEDRRTFTWGDGDQKSFTLHWRLGTVYGQVTMGENASWHEGKLSFKKTPVSLKGVVGKRLADVVGHDMFGDIRIRSSHGEKGKWGWLTCDNDLLYFNAETGRLWGEAA